MRFFTYSKDGGPESKVGGYFLIEIKDLFTIVLLHFWPGSRDAYHTHAFNSVSWVLKGVLNERHFCGPEHFVGQFHYAGIRPILTRRDTFHRVVSIGHSWVLTFRGPWVDTWKEYLPKLNKFVTLTHGRKIVRS
jgi:hypothetical protein